jgi:hypothetical protein
VEQALRANAAGRAERMEQRRERGPATDRPDFMQRLEQRSDMATKYAASATALSSAMKPFWGSLDERQKRLLPILTRSEAGMRGRQARRGGEHRMMHGQKAPAPQAQ